MMTDREASPYDGPVTETTIFVGGKTLFLVRPGDPDRLLDEPEVAAWNGADDYMPYWAYLWPATFLLGDAVVTGGFPSGTRTLELGCGLGVPGLVALSVGLTVAFTDLDRTAFRFVTQSATRNGFDPNSYYVDLLDWRHPAGDRFPLILGADLTYERRLVPLVAGVIAARLTAEGVALIADPDRVACAGFTQAVRDRGLSVAATPAEADGGELGLVRGTVYRITWPGGALAISG